MHACMYERALTAFLMLQLVDIGIEGVFFLRERDWDENLPQMWLI